MTARTLDDLGLRRVLLRACKKSGGQDRFAVVHEIKPDDVGAIIKGERSPDRKVLDALGLHPVTRYARKPGPRA